MANRRAVCRSRSRCSWWMASASVASRARRGGKRWRSRISCQARAASAYRRHQLPNMVLQKGDHVAGKPGHTRVTGAGIVDEPCTLVNPAETEGLRPGSRRFSPGLEQLGGAGTDERQRHEIQPIVLEHGFERSRVARSDIRKVARGNFEPLHIAVADDTAQRAFQDAEAATAPEGPAHPVVPGAPQPSRRVQHVDVRQVEEGRLHPVKQVSGFDEGQVERLAVEGDDTGRPLRQSRDTVEQRRLGPIR